MNVPFHKPYFDTEEIEAVTRSLKRNLIGFGPVVASFEKEFGAYLGASHAIAVNSCTAALHLALDALGIGPGDEVITSPLTFSATVLAIIYTGATPVLADIDPVSLCIDPDSIRGKITPKTKVILPVHYGGRPCRMDDLIEICRQNNLALVEDAAHALPSRWKDRLIGADNNQVRGAVCFSFHATKTLSIGDGGMVTTWDRELADKIRTKRFFGMKRNESRPEIDYALQFQVEVLGYKYNMTDLEASIGKVQLKKLDRMNALRAEAAQKYRERLAQVSQVILPEDIPNGQTSWHLFVIRVKDEAGQGLRNLLLEHLGHQGIKASIHFIPVYQFPFFQSMFPEAPKQLINVENIAGNLLSLPIYPGITEEEINYVVDEIKSFFQERKQDFR